MAHVGQEFALGLASGFGSLLGLQQTLLCGPPLRNVFDYAHISFHASIRSQQSAIELKLGEARTLESELQQQLAKERAAAAAAAAQKAAAAAPKKERAGARP